MEARGYIAIRDNRGRLPCHVYQLRPGESSHQVVERFQRRLSAMTPGGLCGVTWCMLESHNIVAALAESRSRGL